MNDTVELLIRALCDLRPKNPTNGAYLYCQTISNQQSIFKAALSLLNNSLTYKILILNTNAKSGYPGFTEWKQQLQQLGLYEEQIEGVINKETSMINTLIESEAIIRFAKQHSYRSLFVVAPPFLGHAFGYRVKTERLNTSSWRCQASNMDCGVT